jgi:4'-phosphopantetheinyl transferase
MREGSSPSPHEITDHDIPDVWTQPVAQLPDVRGDEIHVWRIRLDTVAEDPARLHALLDAEEQTRAARMRSDADRSRFVVAHAALRTILGGYLGRVPRELRFARRHRGKPFLALDGGETQSLKFNLAHSENLAVCAVARDIELGVDIERLRPEHDLTYIIARYVGPAAVAPLQELDSELRQRQLMQAWVRHESFVKATGVGLMDPPSPDATAAGVRVYDLPATPGYAAAVAAQADAVRISCLDWPGAWTMESATLSS